MVTKSPPPARTARSGGAKPPPKPATRRPFWRNPLVLGSLAAVVVVLGVIVAVAATRGSSNATPAATGADRAVVDAVAHVDSRVFATVGNGGLPNTFVPLKDATPLAGPSGRPEVLYVGADYCPYCAAQRWGLVMALSRFGSFQHLGLTRSSSTDVFPDTATFTFDGATYSSAYVDFVGVETADRDGRPLHVPTDEQKALLARYDAPPYVPADSAGGIPWLDVANRWVMISSGFTPAVLANLSWSDIAGRLGNPTELVTQAIVGDANNITATICKATGMQPAGVCTSAAIAPLVDAVP